MLHRAAGLCLALFAVLSGSALAESSEADAQFFDVSYLWHRNADAVRAYREKVAGVLGPEVAQDLKVVADGALFGLVYHRRSDSAGAVRAARNHTRLLRLRGLESAAPVLSKEWAFVSDAGAAGSDLGSDVAQETPAQPATSMAPVENKRRIHDLELAVEAYIKQLRADGRISADERTAWSVYDFTTGEKLVTINEDTPFQAASLIKPFVAVAYFHKVSAGALTYGSRSRRHMERMIQRSSNWSTNWIMRQVGGPKAVQQVLTRHYPGIFQATQVVEYIPRGGRTYRNKASAHDYSRFLYALWKDNIPEAAEIKRLMSLPGPDRIYTGAEEIPEDTRVYNKTGSTARLCADMGILNVKGPDAKRYPYTLIGIIEKQSKAKNYTAWIRSRGDVIRDVSDIVYRGIAERHDFAEVM